MSAKREREARRSVALFNALCTWCLSREFKGDASRFTASLHSFSYIVGTYTHTLNPPPPPHPPNHSSLTQIRSQISSRHVTGCSLQNIVQTAFTTPRGSEDAPRPLSPQEQKSSRKYREYESSADTQRPSGKPRRAVSSSSEHGA